MNVCSVLGITLYRQYCLLCYPSLEKLIIIIIIIIIIGVSFSRNSHKSHLMTFCPGKASMKMIGKTS